MSEQRPSRSKRTNNNVKAQPNQRTEIGLLLVLSVRSSKSDFGHDFLDFEMT